MVGDIVGLVLLAVVRQDDVGPALATEACVSGGLRRLVAAGRVLGRESEHAAGRRQDGVGTASRYFRHESRSECACGCRSMCVEKTNLGWIGSRISRIPASSGCRLPFRRLHRRHAATTFTHVVPPPPERGTTWSTVNRSPRRLQYWQV